MPFVGGGDFPPARKRRWQDDDDDRGHFNLYRADEDANAQCCPVGGNYPFGISSRKMAAPISKRTRFEDHDGDQDTSHLHNNTGFTPSHRRRISQQSHRSKTPLNTLASAQHRPTKNAVAPCHICHRRPTKKSDLDSFAQCEGCNEQTCFVCIRQCYGRGDMTSVLSEQEALSRSFRMEDADGPGSPDDASDPDGRQPTQPDQEHTKQKQASTPNWAACGHRSVVCSRCCVEKGPEGEVVCLGCLFGGESPDDMAF